MSQIYVNQISVNDLKWMFEAADKLGKEEFNKLMTSWIRDGDMGARLKLMFAVHEQSLTYFRI